MKWGCVVKIAKMAALWALIATSASAGFEYSKQTDDFTGKISQSIDVMDSRGEAMLTISARNEDALERKNVTMGILTQRNLCSVTNKKVTVDWISMIGDERSDMVHIWVDLLGTGNIIAFDAEESAKLFDALHQSADKLMFRVTDDCDQVVDWTFEVEDFIEKSKLIIP